MESAKKFYYDITNAFNNFSLPDFLGNQNGRQSHRSSNFLNNQIDNVPKLISSQKVNAQTESLLEILQESKGLIDIKIKVSIRDSECLSLVYTPGVATPCLDIQQDQTTAYKYTNKGNSIVILTDSSGFKEKNSNWNNNASMIYLEAFSAYYKHIANIDAYPIILDMNLIKDTATLLDTLNAISPSYAGIELFGVSEARMQELHNLYEKQQTKLGYAYLDSNSKIALDEVLKGKKTSLTSNSIFSAVWRVALDSHIFGNLSKILEYIVGNIRNGQIDLNQGNSFYTDYLMILEHVANYVVDNNLINHELDKYNWREQKTSKLYILEKYKTFITYGNKAWVEKMPKGYYMHKHTIPENSELLHYRNKGVIEIKLKVNVKSPEHLNELLKWQSLDEVALKIVEDKNKAAVLTCKSNYGCIVTNGTAVLGLGNIGALAGMPVMEGKSVLFKHFGGTNICVMCIQETNDDKLIAYIQRIAPSFAIINLEDIKGPNCFNIETKLIELVECPMFHDDQHGTAVVTLAGLINAMKLRGSKPEEVKIVMNGAGAAGIAVSQLLLHYGFKTIIVCDTAGAIYKGRPYNMNPFKEKLAEITNKNCEKGKLGDVVKGADVIIGLSGPNTIFPEHIKSMKARPVVFALANPTPEIFPEDAYKAGAFIVATGRSDYPNQINNSVCFPGIFRGTIDTRAPRITMEMKVAASKAIAGLVSDKELRVDYIMPSALNVGTSIRVATDVARVVVEKGLTKMTNIDLDRLQENIHSYFIDEELGDVTKE